MLNNPRALEFFEFIYDRQAIYQKRQAGSKWPWSNDETLNTYRFCNVYRELDKCSIHLIEHIIKNKNLTQQEKFANVVLFRRFNGVNFFTEILGKPWQRKQGTAWVLPRLDAVKKTGTKLFNPAYVISQMAFDKTRRKSEKHAQVVYAWQDFLQKFNFNVLNDESRASMLYDFFRENIYGFGGFMAYQILIDFSYFNWYKCGGEIQKLEEFVDVGPGAIGGLRYISPNVINPAQECRELAGRQQQFFKLLKEKHGKDWDRVRLKDHPNPKATPYLALNNVQNCLCEFRKYINLKAGRGRRRIYRKA